MPDITYENARQYRGLPVSGKAQSRVRHGLITEEIPAKSHIYGSAWYLAKVAKHGEPPLEWLTQARAAHAEVAAAAAATAGAVETAGAVGVVDAIAAVAPIQSTGATNIEMAKPKKPKTSEKETITSFATIKVLYEESETAPVCLNTDSMKIKKEVHGETDVWVTDDGMVYNTNSKGRWGELIGHMKDGEFVPL